MFFLSDLSLLNIKHLGAYNYVTLQKSSSVYSFNNIGEGSWNKNFCKCPKVKIKNF